MDRARDFGFVKQLPRTTPAEVKYQDDVFDKQVLLNETWEHYCDRRGYPPHRREEERVKYVTETWEEYEQRIKQREIVIQTYFDKETQKAKDAEEDAAVQAQRRKEFLQSIEDAENARKEGLLPSLHTLLVDFELQLRMEQKKERADAETEEEEARGVIEKEQQTMFEEIDALARESMNRVLDILEEQRRKREEEERLRREEEERLEQLKREEEERRQREAEEAERKRREAEEEARRAEKKRREEERKARIKAEREARANADKRKSQSEETAAAAAKPAGPPPAELRAKALAARRQRMENEFDAFIRELRQQVTEVKSADDLNKLYKHVALRLGGNILFDTAVYIGVVGQPEKKLIRYTYASENCSDALQSGTVELPLSIDTPTQQECVAKKQGVLVHNVHESPVQVRMLVEGATKSPGDFSAIPILNASGDVIAVIGSDTLDSNKRVTEDKLKDDEKDLLKYGSDEKRELTFISDLQQSWMVDVAATLSKAVLQSSVVELPQCSNLVSLANAITSTVVTSLGGEGVNCYLGRMNRPIGPNECTVVAQNGFTLNGAETSQITTETFSPHSNLLGKALVKTTGLAFQLSGVPFEYVPNVGSDNRVATFAPDATKREDCLLLVPVTDANNRVVFVLGVERSSPPGLTEAEITLVLGLVEQLRRQLLPIIQRRALSSLAQQCVDFLHVVTKCPNIYVSVSQQLLDGHQTVSDVSGPIEYVAATHDQSFVIGESLDSTRGISHTTMSSGVSSKSIPDIAALNIENENEKKVALIRTPPPENASGPLLIAPFGSSFGCVYLDGVGATGKGTNSNKAFAQGDVDMAELVARLLGAAFGDILDPSKESDDTSLPTLAIETDVDPTHIAFLKKVLGKVIEDVKSIKRNDLLEVAAYNRPPELVHQVVAGTLVVLGSTTKLTSVWDDCRKKVKQPLIDKMIAFDPTKKAEKKSARVRFVKARKMLKGFTVESTRAHGSFPTSCFFSWTNIVVQLKFASDRIRKNQADGTLLLMAESNVDDMTVLGGGSEYDVDTSATEGASTAAEDGDEDEDDAGVPDDGEETTTPATE